MLAARGLFAVRAGPGGRFRRLHHRRPEERTME
jgi:hypothetical protein